jgi:hypothetical protein
MLTWIRIHSCLTVTTVLLARIRAHPLSNSSLTGGFEPASNISVVVLASPPAPNQPPACLQALKKQPSPAAWQACGTTVWLRSFVDAHPDDFSDSKALEENGGFLGTFSLMVGLTCLARLRRLAPEFLSGHQGTCRMWIQYKL